MTEEAIKSAERRAYWMGRIVAPWRLDVTAREFAEIASTLAAPHSPISLLAFLGGNDGLEVYIDGRLRQRPKELEERRVEALERIAAALERDALGQPP